MINQLSSIPSYTDVLSSIEQQWFYINQSIDFWTEKEEIIEQFREFWMRIWNLLEQFQWHDDFLIVSPEDNNTKSNPFGSWFFDLHTDWTFRSQNNPIDYTWLHCIEPWKWWRHFFSDWILALQDYRNTIWNDIDELLNKRIIFQKISPDKPFVEIEKWSWNIVANIWPRMLDNFYDWNVFDWERFHLPLKTLSSCSCKTINEIIKKFYDILNRNKTTIELQKNTTIFYDDAKMFHWRETIKTPTNKSWNKKRELIRLHIQKK